MLTIRDCIRPVHLLLFASAFAWVGCREDSAQAPDVAPARLSGVHDSEGGIESTNQQSGDSEELIARTSIEETVSAIEALGGSCIVNSGGELESVVVFDFTGDANVALRELTGFDGLESLRNLTLEYEDEITDEGIQHVENLTSIKYIALPPRVTAVGLRRLTVLDLEMLAYNHSTITDPEMELICSFQNLKVLAMRGSTVTDDQLELLNSLSQLESVILDQTEISDSGLMHLADCSSLKSVSVDRSRVTEAGIDELATLRPDIRVLSY